MVEEFIIGQMEDHMKENIQMIKNKVMVYMYGQMVEVILIF
jgi:hypothetical protein